MYFCLTVEMVTLKMEDRTTKGPARRYLRDPITLPTNSAQAANSTGAPTTCSDTWQPQRHDHAPRRFLPLWDQAMCANYDALLKETGTLSSWWPAASPYQLLPLCLASPLHSQLVWGTLQKREADWFDSPLGNKTSLQPRKHDLQRMTEGTRLFSLAKTEKRHNSYL